MPDDAFSTLTSAVDAEGNGFVTAESRSTRLSYTLQTSVDIWLARTSSPGVRAAPPSSFTATTTMAEGLFVKEDMPNSVTPAASTPANDRSTRRMTQKREDDG
jgi:hypothetical protein